jgi:hypothetical protein
MFWAKSAETHETKAVVKLDGAKNSKIVRKTLKRKALRNAMRRIGAKKSVNS